MNRYELIEAILMSSTLTSEDVKRFARQIDQRLTEVEAMENSDTIEIPAVHHPFCNWLCAKSFHRFDRHGKHEHDAKQAEHCEECMSPSKNHV